MINKNSITKSIIGIAGVATLLVGFTSIALAAVTSTGATTPTPKNSATTLARVIANSDTAIAKRITALNNLSSRIGALKNVPDSEKASIASEVQTQIATLTTLKTKIDADTDVATARADAKTIIVNYRIYALIIPQGYIMASADRVSTIVGLMTTIQTKLQTRITAAQTAGKNITTLQAALTDMTAKLSDATSQAQSAQTAVASLVPDQGNATIATSNKAALMAARADLKTANQDLQAARKDINTVVQGLKALNASTPKPKTGTTQ